MRATRAVPAPGFHHAENGNHQRAQPDQEELQNFVEDRGNQSSQRHVDADGKGGNPNAQVDVPTQHHLHDHGHGVHIDARHQDGQKMNDSAPTRRVGSPKRNCR